MSQVFILKNVHAGNAESSDAEEKTDVAPRALGPDKRQKVAAGRRRALRGRNIDPGDFFATRSVIFASILVQLFS